MQLHLERYSVMRLLDLCTPEYLASRYTNTKTVLGDDAQLLTDNTTAAFGNHSVSTAAAYC